MNWALSPSSDSEASDWVRESHAATSCQRHIRWRRLKCVARGGESAGTAIAADEHAHALTRPARALGDLRHRDELVGLQVHDTGACNRGLNCLRGAEHGIGESGRSPIEVKVMRTTDAADGRVVASRREEGVQAGIALEISAFNDEHELMGRRRRHS